MITLNAFKNRFTEHKGRFPLLTLDEFFNGNTSEDSIAPNQCGYGRPSLAELWEALRQMESMPYVAWVRVALHNDTEIQEWDGKEQLILAGESIVLCTTAQPEKSNI